MPSDAAEVERRVKELAASGDYRVTQHAHQEMVAENMSLTEVLEAIGNGVVIENYPEHRRGPCCLLSGQTAEGRPLHVVCTTESPVLILITVYEPKPPRWSTPQQRGGER